MESQFHIVRHLLISFICYSSTSSYLLHFPNDDQNNYGLFQTHPQQQFNFKRVKDNNWTGWDLNSRNSSTYPVAVTSRLESSDVDAGLISNPDNPEEKIIKFQVLDDAALPKPTQQIRPNRDYWNNIYWPSRYAPGHDKNLTSSKYPYDSYNTASSNSQQYHWQNLRPIHSNSYHKPLTSISNSNSLNFGFGSPGSSSSTASASATASFNGVQKPTNSASSTVNAHFQNVHPFLVTGTGTSNRKHSSDKKYNPSDEYKRRRYRLEIHPGLIAAPIAGFAAYKAVSAFTTNPVLLELGLIKRQLNENEKPETTPAPDPRPHHFHHHHYYSHPQTSTTSRPYHHHGHGHGAGHYHPVTSTDYPVLLPPEEIDIDPRPRPWWSPFAAIIPRFRMMNPYTKTGYAEGERDK